MSFLLFLFHTNFIILLKLLFNLMLYVSFLQALDSRLYSRSVRESVRWQTQFPSESVDKVRALFPSLEPTKNRTNIQYLVMISNNRVVHTEIKLTQLGLYCPCFFRTRFFLALRKAFEFAALSNSSFY